MRIDFDGLGETYGRPGRARNIPTPPEAIDDVVDLAAALGDPDARRLVFVGLSSGAYHAIEAGLRLQPLAVCALNPGLTGWVPEMDHGPLDPRRLAFRPMAPAFRSFAVKHHRIAHAAWRTLLMVRVRRSPADSLCGWDDGARPSCWSSPRTTPHQFEPSPYWSMVRRRLTRRGLLEVRIVPGQDHSTYTVQGQTDTFPILVEPGGGTVRTDPRTGPSAGTVPAPAGQITSAKPRSICSKMTAPPTKTTSGTKTERTICHRGGAGWWMNDQRNSLRIQVSGLML